MSVFKPYKSSCVILRPMIFWAILFAPVLLLLAQSLDVNGTVTTPADAARNALVTFIDLSDTTIQHSATTDRSGQYSLQIPTSIDREDTQPTSFELAQNYPNPFTSTTSIPYQLKNSAEVRLTIYDLLGREVRSISLGERSRGAYSVMWDGLNKFGRSVPAGVYFYRLQAGHETQVKKMVMGTGFRSPDVLFTPGIDSHLSGFEKPVSGIRASDYNVRIESTDRSYPRIETTEFTGISVRNDTTIDFTVDEKIIVKPAVVQLDSTHQLIRGFGGSNILAWRPDMTSGEVETAFGIGEGQLGFTILRLMVESNSDNWSRSIAAAKTAHKMGATIIASPWHAPVEMRETFNEEGDYRVRYDMYDAYAAHLDSFVAYMADNDVPVYGISVQNEPDIGEWTQWTSGEMFTFMRDHAHAITGTNVMAPESYHFDRSYSDPILNDSQASANTDIICGHIYGGGLESYPLAEQKEKEVWMTEYLINSGNPPTNVSVDTGWTGAMQTAESILKSMNANMSAYVWWYIVRYYGPIGDGTYLRKGAITKKGYVMSQFSRFIRPGYHRVDVTEHPTKYVSVSAYKGDTAVIVAINNGEQAVDQQFEFNGGVINSVIPYTTTKTQNVEERTPIQVTDGNFTATLPPMSITTVVSR
ncbi:MAG: T9SS type A sorting domain-containing protein [Candidatus Marinimicrobia bacterium]|nr:T9SS type A sorting domain-containing protein [Candidatus Neomarinimicrobiota bacterium]MCF7880610.1 T9SS type A sorting domain-containing protein [Candidatus Neomarinimicrobiota bacterium]